MRLVKLAIISSCCLAIVMIAISLFLPSHVRISRAINMRAGSGKVLDNINDLSKWRQWYPGFEKVQLLDTVINNGKMVRAVVNRIVLAVITNNDSLITVQMKKGIQPVYNSWKLIRYQHSDSLTLQNYMDFYFKWYPWEKLSSLLLERSYGDLMSEGLENLKKLE